ARPAAPEPQSAPELRAAPPRAPAAQNASAPLELDVREPTRGAPGRGGAMATPGPRNVQAMMDDAAPPKGTGLGTKIAIATIIAGSVLGGLYAAGVFKP
ncbi:MAG: hypothetical protein ABI175_08025, partial [Polyangiales bacterium]